jgi:hypothetical protein
MMISKPADGGFVVLLSLPYTKSCCTDDVIFLPRGVPHNFKVTSPKASVTLIVTPGGLEDFFERITFPCSAEAVPPVTGAPSGEHIQRIRTNAALFGMQFV